MTSKARLSPEDELELLEKKEAKLKARMRDKKARVKNKIRKQDTRKKILIGALFLSDMDGNDKMEKFVMDRLDKYLTNDRDRALFDLPPASSNKSPTP